MRRLHDLYRRLQCRNGFSPETREAFHDDLRRYMEDGDTVEEERQTAEFRRLEAYFNQMNQPDE